MSAKPHSLHLKRTIIAGVSYFAVVFGAGFILGPIRILLIVPRVGERAAELMEAPLMLIVMVIAARWIVRRFDLTSSRIDRVVVGLLAIVLGLLFEFTLVLKFRGLTLTDYLRTRDPVSGMVYYLILGLFAIMPLLFNRKERTEE